MPASVPLKTTLLCVFSKTSLHATRETAFIEVIERMEAEIQSRRFAAVLQDSSDAIALLDLDGRIKAWNRGAETLYGYAEADALKMSLYDLVAPEGRERTRDIIMRVT